MGTKKTDDTEETSDGKLSDAQLEQIQGIVNGALGAHAKRTEKSITDLLTKALETKAAAAPVDEPKDAAKPDKSEARAKALEARLAETIKRLDDSEKARRKDAAHSSLRAAYEAAGVRKDMIDVLVNAASVDGTLRYDEEGKPSIAVKRARIAGGAAEEHVFDDFKQGIDDWAKTPTAAAFMQAPGKLAPNGAARPVNGSAPKVYAKEAASEEESIQRVLERMAAG